MGIKNVVALYFCSAQLHGIVLLKIMFFAMNVNGVFMQDKDNEAI